MGVVLDFLTIVLLLMMFRRIIGFFLRLLKPMDQKSVHNTKTYDHQEDMNNVAREVHQPIEMVKDPVCGKYIQEDKAYQLVTNENQIVHFCSWDCREKYIENK